MNRQLAAFILIIFAGFSAAAQETNLQQRSRIKTEKEVLAFLDALDDAGRKRDVTLLEGYYAEDFFHTNPDGSIMTRTSVLDSYKSPSTMVIDSNQHNEDKVWNKGNVALVNRRVTIKGRFDNRPYERQWRVTYVFEKVKNKWRAVASHATLILPRSKAL